MTTQFHHINLCAKDPSDLENFYKDVLELSESHAYTGNQKQIKNQGYGGRVAFLTDGQSEMHLSTLDLNVAFRTKQPINPLERGHIAFRTDDIEGIKRRLTERDVPLLISAHGPSKDGIRFSSMIPRATSSRFTRSVNPPKRPTSSNLKQAAKRNYGRTAPSGLRSLTIAC